jgi:hypothetical protein
MASIAKTIVSKPYVTRSMIYKDGKGHEHARQEILFIDFPLAKQTLYACWDCEHRVISALE